MTTQATLGDETSVCGEALYMVLELSGRRWKILVAAALSGRRRERSVAAGDLAGLLRMRAMLVEIA